MKYLSKCIQQYGYNYLKKRTANYSTTKSLSIDASESMSKEAKTPLKFFEKKLVPYSCSDTFSVISNCNNYKRFLPWCQDSKLIYGEDGKPSQVYLKVGYGPITEYYTSKLVINEPYYLSSECNDGSLFKKMLTVWETQPVVLKEGTAAINNQIKDLQNKCIVSVSIEFIFMSTFHELFAKSFMDSVGKVIMRSFEKELQRAHGVRPPVPQRFLVHCQSK